MNSIFKAVLVLCSAVIASGCGPSLESQIPVPHIPTPEIAEKLSGERRMLVFVDEFLDERESMAFVEGEDETAQAEGELARGVQSAVRRALETKGFTVTDEAPLVLSGEVREWRAKVDDGFPPEVASRAVLFVSVFDPANKRVFSGEYSGTATVKQASMSQKDVQEAMGLAMSQAVSQIVSDEKLVRLLRSF